MLGGWIFTFGAGHRHPETGEPIADRFVRIPGSEARARAAMFALFGPAWAHQYRSEEDAGVARYGLRELDVARDVTRLIERARAVAPLREDRFRARHAQYRRLATNWLDATVIDSAGAPGFVAQIILELLDENEALRRDEQ